MKKIKEIASKATKRGFYIILFLCICAIGVSGYVMFNEPQVSDDVLGYTDTVEDFSFPEPSGMDFEPVMLPEITEVEEEKKEPEQKAEVKDSAKVQTQPTQKAVATVKKQEIEVEPKEISYQKPLDGEVSLKFSGDELIKSKTMDDWRIHTGVDIAAPSGTKVHAIAAGTVMEVFEDEMMGYTVKIRHKEGCVSTYSNLMKGIVVKKGDKVKLGQVIGGIGDSAIAECMEPAHLHLELTQNNVNIDPMTVIK